MEEINSTAETTAAEPLTETVPEDPVPNTEENTVISAEKNPGSENPQTELDDLEQNEEKEPVREGQPQKQISEDRGKESDRKPQEVTESGRNMRDYTAEWKELAEAHPEVVGTTLPQDIFQACITSDKPPLQVYESMMLQHLQGELAQMKQENERLRQNADNAQRAPVIGISSGGSAHMQEEDPFVAAFKRYR